MSDDRMIPTPGFLDTPLYWDHGGPLHTKPFEMAVDCFFYSAVLRRTITIPAWYRWDMLSIPWGARLLIHRNGVGRRAAIPHDWLCDVRPSWCSAWDAHRVFEEALRLEPSVPRWKRRAMTTAVYAFGPRW